MRQAAGVLVLREKDGQIFVLAVCCSRKSGVPDDWGLPCGKVEEGEDPRVAAQREAGEETGLDLVLESEPIYVGRGRSHLVTTYRAYPRVPNAEPTSSSEGEARWVPKEKVLSGTYAAYNRRVFDALGSRGEHLE